MASTEQLKSQYLPRHFVILPINYVFRIQNIYLANFIHKNPPAIFLFENNSQQK